jgi:hypothetical protein
MTWWFVYMIFTTADGPKVRQMPTSPAFHTEEMCTGWLIRELRSGRLAIAEDVLATCMSPGEDI